MNAIGIIGIIGCCPSILAHASPLSVIRNVIQTKSVSALPFGLCLALTLNAGTWLCYGYCISGDIYIWLPCLVSVGAGLMQLSLFAIY